MMHEARLCMNLKHLSAYFCSLLRSETY